MDADTYGLTPHRIDAGHLGDADRTLYQWLNGRTAKGVGWSPACIRAATTRQR